MNNMRDTDRKIGKSKQIRFKIRDRLKRLEKINLVVLKQQLKKIDKEKKIRGVNKAFKKKEKPKKIKI